VRGSIAGCQPASHRGNRVGIEAASHSGNRRVGMGLAAKQPPRGATEGGGVIAARSLPQGQLEG
jgi:hypothetical protein